MSGHLDQWHNSGWWWLMVLVIYGGRSVIPTMTEFYDYVLSFYGADGLYPMGATLKLVKQATSTHIKILKLKGDEFAGDSIDRECVRELLMTKYKLQPLV